MTGKCAATLRPTRKQHEKKHSNTLFCNKNRTKRLSGTKFAVSLHAVYNRYTSFWG